MVLPPDRQVHVAAVAVAVAVAVAGALFLFPDLPAACAASGRAASLCICHSPESWPKMAQECQKGPDFEGLGQTYPLRTCFLAQPMPWAFRITCFSGRKLRVGFHLGSAAHRSTRPVRSFSAFCLVSAAQQAQLRVERELPKMSLPHRDPSSHENSVTQSNKSTFLPILPPASPCFFHLGASARKLYIHSQRQE